MKGSKMLQVVSIIMIVFAAIATLIALLAIVGGGAMVGSGDGTAVAAGAVVLVASILLLIIAVFELIMGIVGVKNCKNPAKAQTCFILGIIVLVLQCVSLVMNLDSLSISSFTGFILPGLYTYGAYQLKQNNSAE